jgi:ketosteroid isomerase-like protein
VKTAAAADPDVADLLARASQAHAALMRGDIDAYLGRITTTPDFTLMAPFGGPPSVGIAYSPEQWASIGRFFRRGRDTSLELVQAWRSDDMVVLAAIERAQVEVGGLAAQHWALRVTLVFRRKQGQWCLAHRHADPLVAGISVAQAAALARSAAP